MQLFRTITKIDFMGMRRAALGLSVILIIGAVASLTTRGLNFGIDFTGGTLVETSYSEAVEIANVRDALEQAGFGEAVVQYFGTAKDIMVRLPVREGLATAEISNKIMSALRGQLGERLVAGADASAQLCVSDGTSPAPCQVQMRRVEFVGPQVGAELANKGGLAMLYALVGILFYVAWRFEWRFAVGSIAALVHDVTITTGILSFLQVDFSLTVLAALLAVIGYSLNDTIVVFDRIRENFRKLRKRTPVKIVNVSINETLPRTLLTSVTTMLVLLALFFLGGDIIHGFAIALIIGVVVGTYSSIFVASPLVLQLGLTREDMLPVKKEGAELDGMP